MYNDQSAVMPPLQFQGRPGVLAYEQLMGPSPGYSNLEYGIGQQTPSAPSSGAGGYRRLPTAQPVNHAMQQRESGKERQRPLVLLLCPRTGCPLMKLLTGLH